METDILISGAGVAGLTAAAAFGSAGFRVICIDPKLPVTVEDDPDADLRTTALLQPSKALLEEIEVWPALSSHATPLHTMRIVDAFGQPIDRAFESHDVGDAPLSLIHI